MPIYPQPVGSDLLATDADILVNTVNTVGVMGAGIALQFKRRFPGMFFEYRRRCRAGEVRTGRIDQHIVMNDAGRDVLVANFPTKEHWRDPSRLEWVTAGLIDLVRIVNDTGATSIAIPPLGCGLGGLDWQTVEPLIVEAMTPAADCDLDVLLFQPQP